MTSELQYISSWEPLVYDPKLLKEERAANGGRLILRGILQRADALNQNGRVYPRPILEREVRNYQKLIRERRSLGECDHPEESVISLKNASHLVIEAVMDGDVCKGAIEILPTPSGKILESLVESGVTLGISSRGVGSTVRDGERQIVQDDFQLICWDVVAEPSTSQAFLFREGRERGLNVTREDLDKFFNRSDRIDRIMNDIVAW